MSRIHEALKKAEQERAMSVSPKVGPKPADPTVVGAVRNEGAGLSAKAILCSSEVGLPQTPSGYLRLDELREHCSKPGWKVDPSSSIFCNKQGRSVEAEQFRTLRSRLYRLREKQTLRTVLVASALPGEGKTFIAVNLAQAIVRQHERRALVIDADLRSSGLHVPLGAPSAPGLTDYLRGEANGFSIIQCDSQDNLYLIPGGRPVSNPAELLASARLKSLLDCLAPLFDWIILDSPPALPVSDAGVLAGLCDGVMLVIRAASTPLDLVQKACQEFREKNLIGVVLNRAEEAAAYAAYSYYSGDGKDKR